MERDRLTAEYVEQVMNDAQTECEKEKECTDKIVRLAREIVNTYREYNPDGNYLHISFLAVGKSVTPTLYINNDYWEDSFKITHTEEICDEINRCR